MRIVSNRAVLLHDDGSKLVVQGICVYVKRQVVIWKGKTSVSDDNFHASKSMLMSGCPFEDRFAGE